MTQALRAWTVLLGLVFTGLGIQWHVDPAVAAEGLGMVLQEGVGRSSQIGDVAAFFLTGGLCTLIGAVTRVGFWFYPPLMLVGFAVIGRVLAWLIHDAAFAGPMIVAEVVFAVSFFAANRWLPTGQH